MKSTPGLILLMAGAILTRIPTVVADEGKPVKLASLPEPAVAAIKKLAGKGKITRLTVEKHGAHVEFEASVTGPYETSREVTVDEDGMLISTGEFISLSRAPGIIRKVAAAAAAGGKLVTCQRIVENGETTFEVVVERYGKTQEVAFMRDGTLKDEAEDDTAREGAKEEKKVKQKIQKVRKEMPDDDEHAKEKSEKREQKIRKAHKDKADDDGDAKEEKNEKRELKTRKARKEKGVDDDDSNPEKEKPDKARKEEEKGDKE